MKDDRLYLTHIKESLEKIKICASEGYDAFVEDFKLRDKFHQRLNNKY